VYNLASLFHSILAFYYLVLFKFIFDYWLKNGYIFGKKTGYIFGLEMVIFLVKNGSIFGKKGLYFLV